ncbi:hypothetical protein G6F57_023110 [Rhizopus arrhizus]|nr:hypothetical protein G6F24_018252 [Rhizopus arrhizus]KAG1429620.1 hypothetical protein G6F57_023110 [Rhizopus arrhizus]
MIALVGRTIPSGRFRVTIGRCSPPPTSSEPLARDGQAAIAVAAGQRLAQGLAVAMHEQARLSINDPRQRAIYGATTQQRIVGRRWHGGQVGSLQDLERRGFVALRAVVP